ncbi:hypothetical protein FJR38_26885 [Anabaena sp. UHCC 0253]|nr:hypothetical protein [Anabaena sp. UHCC 0253]
MKKSKHRENGEIKRNISVGVTETAIAGLDAMAEMANVSRSHLIEMIGRGELPVAMLSPQSLGES